jgi:hypothetical protein
MNALVCSTVLLLGLAPGADPVLLPAPTPRDPSLTALPPGIGFYRPNPYDRWQNYAPDQYGRWRPRVIVVPGDGAYRVIDGKPAVAPYSHPHYWMPYAD